MGLGYSQKRLVSAPVRGSRRQRHRRLALYAVLTGLISVLVSVMETILIAEGKW